MPFTMTLKLEKDKVTGEIGSQQGAVPITEGSFVDGKLTITFTYVDGNAVVMSGVVADGAAHGQPELRRRPDGRHLGGQEEGRQVTRRLNGGRACGTMDCLRRLPKSPQ